MVICYRQGLFGPYLNGFVHAYKLHFLRDARHFQIAFRYQEASVRIQRQPFHVSYELAEHLLLLATPHAQLGVKFIQTLIPHLFRIDHQAILKEIKAVKEQIDTCPADRTELLEEYKKRYEIMNEFAPKLLSAEEVKDILTTKFAELIATKDKGQIMKAVMVELKGKADGKVISQTVAELLK